MLRKSKNVSYLTAKASMKEQGDFFFSSLMSVPVKRLDQDKDTDENVDAEHVRTRRSVESEKSIDLFTQREEIDIDFRVSGLTHVVVKQVENFPMFANSRRKSRIIHIDKDMHFRPICNKITSTIHLVTNRKR